MGLETVRRRTKIIGFVLISLVFIVCSGYFYLNSYVKYVPIIQPNNDPDYEYIQAPKVNTEEHKENLKVILEHYSIKFQTRKSEIFIQRKVALDKEMVYNLTRNANDHEFVKIAKEENEKWRKTLEKHCNMNKGK